MTVTGGIKFFEKSKCLYVDDARAYSLRGDSAQYMLNHNRDNGWISTGSDDTTTEQIVIDLDSVTAIDRIILNKHNFKDVTIYLLSEKNRLLLQSADLVLKQDGTSNIVLQASEFEDEWKRYIIKQDGFFIVKQNNPNHKIKAQKFLNAPAAATAETLQRTLTDSNITTSTSYFSFDSTLVKRIIMEVTTTQVANAQKYLQCFIATNEIGTFEGFPAVSKLHDRHRRKYQTLSGKNIVMAGLESINVNVSFKGYPGQDDHDLIESLHDTDEDFLVWLCGGREGLNYFTYNLRGWTIDDLYLMQITNSLPLNYVNSIYTNPFDAALQMVQVVG